jgi:hypothetical protein
MIRPPFSNVSLTLITLIALSLIPTPSLFAAESKNLEETMEEMNDAYKALKKQVGDSSKNADSHKLVLVMQETAVRAKKLAPALAAEKQGPDKDKFMVAYQKSMSDLLVEYVKLEVMVLDGKNADAEGQLKKIIEMKNAAHKVFQKE